MEFDQSIVFYFSGHYMYFINLIIARLHLID